jgi:hypothetical protein
MLPSREIVPDHSHIYFLVFGLGNATIRADTDSGVYFGTGACAARDITLPEI